MDLFGPVVEALAGEAVDLIDFGDNPEDVKHVLVFGSSGTGKTSFINALTGLNMKTGSGSRGVTLESHEIGTSHNGVDYRIVDTAGLNEAEHGAVPGVEALKSLVRLLKRTENGLNLMIMVVAKGRMLASTLNNYNLFVKKMTSELVPLLIVVTHCEREQEDMQQWVHANVGDFEVRGITAKRIVATTFMTPNPECDNVAVMNTKRALSVELSWNAIETCASARPVQYLRQGGGFIAIIRKMYNAVARNISAGLVWVSGPFVDLIQRVTGAPREEAMQAAREVETSR